MSLYLSQNYLGLVHPKGMIYALGQLFMSLGFEECSINECLLAADTDYWLWRIETLLCQPICQPDQLGCAEVAAEPPSSDET